MMKCHPELLHSICFMNICRNRLIYLYYCILIVIIPSRITALICYALAKPTIAGDKLTVLRDPKSASATVSWSEPRGFYTDIKIRVFEVETETCRLHAVNTSENRSITQICQLDADKTYRFMLQLYDNADLVYASDEFASTSQGNILNESGIIIIYSRQALLTRQAILIRPLHDYRSKTGKKHLRQKSSAL